MNARNVSKILELVIVYNVNQKDNCNYGVNAMYKTLLGKEYFQFKGII